MKVSDLMKAMSDAGAPMEAILIAVRALEAREEEIGTRRASDRERKRRQRARDRGEDVTVTGQSRDAAVTVTDDPSLSLPPLSSPQTPQHTPPTHTHSDGDTPRARKADPFPRPEWADPQVWRDLKANRKAKRLPCTATAHAKLLRDLDKLTDDEWPPGRLLEAIVARGWAAAYDPRETRNSSHDRKSPDDDELKNPYARVAARREAQRAAAVGG